MPRPELLTEQERVLELKLNPDWISDGVSITRELVASNFVAAVGIVNSIAVLAETLDHHPDILLYGWNKIRVVTSTHDKGGLTKLDFELAKKIDDLNF